MLNNCCLYYSHIFCISSIVQHCTFGIIIDLYKFVYKQAIEAFLKKNPNLMLNLSSVYFVKHLYMFRAYL